MRPVITPVKARRERCAATLSTHLPDRRQPLDGSTGIPIPAGRREARIASPTTTRTKVDRGSAREHGAFNTQERAPNAASRDASSGIALTTGRP